MASPLRRIAVLLTIAAASALAGCGDSTSDAPKTTATSAAAPVVGPAFGSMDRLPGVLKTAPPWSSNGDELQLRLRAIGLPALSAEGQVVHIHQHLDLFVDGKPVAVPGDIGVGGSFISPLHTHTEPTPSIMHIESPTEGSFSLGQFFAVWGLRLDGDCIGAQCAGEGKQLRTWVNGKPFDGDPTRLVLASHQQIVIAYGTAAQMPDPVPASYDFPPGL